MTRRSRQNIDRRKGGNYTHVNLWVPVEVKDAALAAAKTRGVTLTELVIQALERITAQPDAGAVHT